MRWSKKAPRLLACPGCNGRGRRHVKTWTMGKGYIDKGKICTTCKGGGVLPK